ncbi:uncharacterized protein [Rutidosis leptorrhynchoides]|uniref:uncharacterized protein n=1 Tax=Rutidosis leptorrhynchoides TaxID=125765 RepID=UPI003A9978F0
METRKLSSMVASCKKHPMHQQSPGVCSLCLRERLSKISGSSSHTISALSSSCSTSFISTISSACSSYKASPMHKDRNQRKTNDDHVEGKGYFSFLRKSRSMAYVSEKIVNNGVKKKKGGGFWSRLIGLRKDNKRSTQEGSTLTHSRTTRETLTTLI